MQIFKVLFLADSRKPSNFVHMKKVKEINKGLWFDPAVINRIEIANASSKEWNMLRDYIVCIIVGKGYKNTFYIEELTDRCIEKMLNSLKTYNPERGKLTTWVNTVLRTTAWDYNQELDNTPCMADIEDVKAFHEAHTRYDADSYDRNEAINLLYKFASKQTGEKRVLTLMVLRDCENHEIAERLGVKAKVVEVRKTRLKTEMRAFLKLNGFDYLPLTA